MVAPAVDDLVGLRTWYDRASSGCCSEEEDDDVEEEDNITPPEIPRGSFSPSISGLFSL